MKARITQEAKEDLEGGWSSHPPPLVAGDFYSIRKYAPCAFNQLYPIRTMRILLDKSHDLIFHVAKRTITCNITSCLLDEMSNDDEQKVRRHDRGRD